MNTIVWLRTDLRLHDNPALAAAAQAGHVTALYLIAPEQWRAHADAPVKVDFWLRNLRALFGTLGALNIPLKILTISDWSQAASSITKYCETQDISEVHVNGEWGLNEIRRDNAVAAALQAQGIGWTLHHGGTLLRPGSVLNGKGETYRVFSPFARACRERLRTAPIMAVRAPKAQAGIAVAADPVPEAIDGFDAPPLSMQQRWPAGETAAHARLRSFADDAIMAYHDTRDLPAHDGTSGLSPYLAAGVISPAQCLRAALSANHGELDSGQRGATTWISELLWREFYQHLLAAFPGLSMHQPMKPHTAAVPWRDAPEDLQAWQEGRTGFPIVDAAMRQLLATGWMHNRLRMVTAMFLSKNLLIDWRYGEAWFMAHLVDGDLAANNGGWQWSASTGADAVPYFRVFNPLSQSRKFDPDAAFLRRWLPELAQLDNHSIHDPSPLERAACAYPDTIVDLGHSRLRALEAFSALRV